MDERRCTICGEGGRMVLDHDHATGMSRGWLCQRCNVMLGYAADSPDRLTQAAAYLAKPGGRARKPRNSRAAYMRDYRQRQQSARVVVTKPDPSQAVRITELKAEVARLKRELAARPPLTGHVFNSRPFTPVPKPGKH